MVVEIMFEAQGEFLLITEITRDSGIIRGFRRLRMHTSTKQVELLSHFFTR